MMFNGSLSRAGSDGTISSDSDSDSSLSNCMSAAPNMSLDSRGSENSGIWTLGTLKSSNRSDRIGKRLKGEPPLYEKEDTLGHSAIELGGQISKTGPKEADLSDVSSSKLICLKSFKNGGTKFSHAEPEPKPFVYNVFDNALNKCHNVHDSSSAHVELKIDQSTIYLPGLLDDLKGSSAAEIIRNETDFEMLSTYKTSLTGSVILTVKKNSLVLQNLEISMKGYSTEYVCLTDEITGQRTRRVLKHNGSGNFTYLEPFLKDTINIYEKYPVVLTKGTYIIPFTFLIDPLNYHSTIKSFFGSTCYRVEMKLTKLVHQDKNLINKENINNRASSGKHGKLGLLSSFTNPTKKYETIFLTKQCSINKTLSPSCLLKFESVSAHGSYLNHVLNYDFFLSSKLIEMDSKFQIQLGFLTAPDIVIEKVKIQLVQISTIPCVAMDGITSLKKSYIHSNVFDVAETESLVRSDNFFQANFDELLLKTTATSSILDSKILPYYSEMSRLNPVASDSGQLVSRAKLKITHYLKITTSFSSSSNESIEPSKRANVNFKVPVMVVDQHMSSSLHLPPYEPQSKFIEDYNYDSPSSNDFPSPPSYGSVCC